MKRQGAISVVPHGRSFRLVILSAAKILRLLFEGRSIAGQLFRQRTKYQGTSLLVPQPSQ